MTKQGNSVPNPTKAPAVKAPKVVSGKDKTPKTPTPVQKINQGKLR